MSAAKILFILKNSVFYEKNPKNNQHNHEPGSAKRGLTLFFTLGRKRACVGGLGRIRGEVGAKLGRSRRGGVGGALTDDDGPRYHFRGVGKMITQRFELNQLGCANMDQCRRVRPGLHAAPCRGRCRSAHSAGDERQRNQGTSGKQAQR